MLMYILTIVIASIIIAVLNIVLGSYAFDLSALWVCCAVVLSVIAEIAIDGVFAIIIQNWLPEKWFSSDRRWTRVGQRERNFYEKIKIRSWKDKVLELGALGGFRKNKIKDPNSSEYLNKFIIESNKGVIIHIVCVFVGIFVIFVLPLKYALRIGLPVIVVNALLNILPTFILRYNMPKLLVAYQRAKKKEQIK